jgi:hypothetical protein
VGDRHLKFHESRDNLIFGSPVYAVTKKTGVDLYVAATLGVNSQYKGFYQIVGY